MVLMSDLNDLMRLTTVMKLNNGVLRAADHPQSRVALNRLLRCEDIVRVLPGTFVDASLVSSRLTRCAAALATYPGSLLWGSDAVATVSGTLDATSFGDRDSVNVAHAQSRHASSGVNWTRRQIPAEHRVRIDGLRCPSARFLAVEAAARDEGALIDLFLRGGKVKPAELPAVLPVFAATKGHQVRCRVVRTSVDNPWSGGERNLHALLRRHRIHRWTANAELLVDGRCYFPDVLFEAARLVLEFDGFAVHSKPEIFESDRRRQNALILGGYRVLRFTWRQVKDDPALVVAQIRAALAREIASDPGGT